VPLPVRILRRPALAALALGAVALVAGPRSAQPREFDEIELKIALIGRIADFVTWPAEAGLDDPHRPLELVVLGETALFPSIRKYYENVRIAGHRVWVHTARDVGDVERPHLLFIGPSYEERLGEVLARVRGVPVLTVGDTEGYARRGIAINLYPSGPQIRFEVSRRALESHGLRASFRMLSLARLIDDQQARR
jgi:hypothetical protein